MPRLARAGGAARAWSAFVAGARGVIEIGATRPLKDIAADGRGIAELRGRAGQQRLGNSREAAPEIGKVGEIGIANERADAHTDRRKDLRCGRGQEYG